jgi:predicted nucleic acid-binding Zn ribbon protein
MSAARSVVFHNAMDNASTSILDALRAELRELMASWEYAFAMGHGCSVGDHPRHRAVRERVVYLKAQIAEHAVQ